MRSPHREPAEELLKRLSHDLRQHLGNIETSAYVLKLLLDDGPEHVRKHLLIIERQVESAAMAVSAAAAELRQLQTRDVESLERTNVVTAAVT